MMNKVKLKHVKFKTILDDWNLDVLDNHILDIKDVVLKGIAEVIDIILKEGDTYIYFPVQYGEDGSDGLGGAPVKDPLTIYVRLGVSEVEENPTFSFNLREALEDEMEDVLRLKKGGYLKKCLKDGGFKGLPLISNELKILANEIDEALKP